MIKETIKMNRKDNSKLKILINVSLLIALEVVLSRFCSITTPIVKIGFGFMPIVVCAIMFGPIWAGGAGALADVIGATLFPIAAYFPGFTVSAALTGIVFGIFLHNRKGTIPQLAGAVAVNCLCISLLMNTYWLTIIIGTPFLGLLPTRIVQNLIMIPVQFGVLKLLQKPISIFVKWQISQTGDSG